MGSLLLTIGVAGCLGMTWLFPLLANLLSCAQAGAPPKTENHEHRSVVLNILLPVHNGEKSIAATLESVLLACHIAREKNPNLRCEVLVGLDGCNDNTAQIAARYGVKIYEFPKRRGKWHTVRELVKMSGKAGWVALVDCGTRWPEEFLVRVLPHFLKSNCVALAPSYVKSDGGILEHGLWLLERHLKSLEGCAGGPVTVHGATVFYRRRELCRAFYVLGSRDWLNDDVVVPMMLRTLFPQMHIAYLPSFSVYDGRSMPWDSKVSSSSEFARRSRIAAGNTQWMRCLLPALCMRNHPAALVALRRAFRVLWAYWLALFMAGLILRVSGSSSITVLLAALGAMLISCLVLREGESPVCRLASAAAASLAAPLYFLMPFERGAVRWA